jgi:hypothetical protein
MSMPANPACFVAFLALVRRRRTTGVSDREDRSPSDYRRSGGQENSFSQKAKRKRRKRRERREKRLLTF